MPLCYTVPIGSSEKEEDHVERGRPEHVIKHMATKEDISGLRAELKGDIGAVHTQVNSIERQLRETKTEIGLSNLELDVLAIDHGYATRCS